MFTYLSDKGIPILKGFIYIHQLARFYVYDESDKADKGGGWHARLGLGL